jgi:hypothetical protein
MNLKKNKKQLGLLFGLVLCLGLVNAVWIFNLTVTGNAVYQITSDEPTLTITRDLLGGSFDTTDNSIYIEDFMTIDAETQDNARIDFAVLKEDVFDSCTDYIYDCNFSIWHNDSGFMDELGQGEVISLDVGDNFLYINGSCLEDTCPQNISIELNASLIES